MKKRWRLHRECVPSSVDVGRRDVSCTLTPQKVARISLFTRDPAFLAKNDGSFMSGGWHCGAVATTSVRELGSIVKYDVRGTFASGGFLEFATLTGARTPFFRK